MTALDRRRFVLGLSSALAGLSLTGACSRVDSEGLGERLAAVFGDDEAWRVLGNAYLEQSEAGVDELLLALARRLGWRSDSTVEALTRSILEQMKRDFEQGWIGGPDNWGLAETELQIYAVLANAADSEAGPAGR